MSRIIKDRIINGQAIRNGAHCFYWLSKTTCLALITTADSTNNIEQATTQEPIADANWKSGNYV